ncbi:homoserine kinase [Thalassotalea sp. 1_MG-2023]|uniref:homoserine kinase n=1 Tax=Thalassotalea sp. 1_MG-2023 TaxID=3062680 RepID=UPI0026E1F062|nr:homoserine kinase [Thalassotalea sp. 1_MG-2023]MDO6427464.1 homoserine kinase [Thalassotalea sp. 1_MG-2023]
MSVSVFAPASIGNMSVGFDVLGVAVKPVDGTLLGDIVTVEASPENRLTVVGAFANKLPQDPKENIVWDCLQLFNESLLQSGQQPVTVNIILEKKMPVGSGLGSSACSVVAALEALNYFYKVTTEFQFSKAVMLKLMGRMEAQISGSLHYDNVAPCYYGGIQLMVPDDNVICQTLPQFEDCYYVMAYPGIEVSTKAAREVLPASYSRKDVITFGQNLATFVDACHRGNKALAFSVVNDVIAQPYRQHLLPGFEQACAHLHEQGCLAVGISGSGPTLFCVTDNEQKANDFANWLKAHYLQTLSTGQSEGFVHVCRVDNQGACPINK